jgi:hypothetical protein
MGTYVSIMASEIHDKSGEGVPQIKQLLCKKLNSVTLKIEAALPSVTSKLTITPQNVRTRKTKV